MGTAITGQATNPPDHAWQRALHTGADHNHDAALHQRVVVMQQPVQASHAHVGDGLDIVAHDLGRQLRFFHHRKITGARADDGNLAFAATSSGRARHAPLPKRESAPLRLGLHEQLSCFRGGAGDQHILRLRQQRLSNAKDLVGRLPFAENHFRHALPHRTMVIHLGEARSSKGR